MGILAPRIGTANLRHDAAELRIGQYIDPRRWRRPAWDMRHDVLAAIGTETAIGVGELQDRLAHLSGRCIGRHTVGGAGFECCQHGFGAMPVQLFGKAAVAVA
ncbi:hypothetical protein D3C81_1868840 [compost metagenome]